MIFKRRPKLNETTLRTIVSKLEDTYVNKQIEKLEEMFHPNHRNHSFLNHFTLMMNFQIYHIESEIIHFELLDVSEDTATMTYTRKHMYTCIQKEDEDGSNPNNISSYYVKVHVENKKIWITNYSLYSELFLDVNGQVLPGDAAIVPPTAQYFSKIEKLIHMIKLDHLEPATYLLYDNSEMIGYYPKNERYCFYSSEKLTFDYFEEMEAETMDEHVKMLIDSNELEYSHVVEQADEYSIVELKFQSNHKLQREFILSMLVAEGLFMGRYLVNDEIANNLICTQIVNKMIEATMCNGTESDE